MRVVICNFGKPGCRNGEYDRYWAETERPVREQRLSLFEYKVDWGFHLYALGVYMLDNGIADEVEFWNFASGGAQTCHRRGMSYHYMGVLRVNFLDEQDVFAYIRRYGVPDLLVNHGRQGIPILQHLEGHCFRVHVPASRTGLSDQSNHSADCYLVDSTEFLDSKSILYIPVVNTKKIAPTDEKTVRDFIYLAWPHQVKRHDIVIDAVRNRDISGHFHPVPINTFDLRDTLITTSDLNEMDLVELLCSSRIAVYSGDQTSNPAAMWECVAAGLPIVMNESILGGHHLVVPGVTGELAREDNFLTVMEKVIENRDRYEPREYFEENWRTESVLERYLDFFESQGWRH